MRALEFVYTQTNEVAEQEGRYGGSSLVNLAISTDGRGCYQEVEGSNPARQWAFFFPFPVRFSIIIESCNVLCQVHLKEAHVNDNDLNT